MLNSARLSFLLLTIFTKNININVKKLSPRQQITDQESCMISIQLNNKFKFLLQPNIHFSCYDNSPN